jgi:hypothetical protein
MQPRKLRKDICKNQPKRKHKQFLNLSSIYSRAILLQLGLNVNKRDGITHQNGGYYQALDSFAGFQAIPDVAWKLAWYVTESKAR